MNSSDRLSVAGLHFVYFLSVIIRTSAKKKNGSDRIQLAFLPSLQISSIFILFIVQARV